MFANMNLVYSLLIIKSIAKKSFAGLGTVIKKSGAAIKKILCNAKETEQMTIGIAQQFFKQKTKLFLAIDDTLIKKTFSQIMQGSGHFYDTKSGRRLTAYKLLCASITDGKYTFPLESTFLFDKNLGIAQCKIEIVKNMIQSAQRHFPKARIIVVADGAFATRVFFEWAVKNSVAIEVRMPSNRKVEYEGIAQTIRDIKSLRPKGRQMARTIRVCWHNISLFITAQRRIDKHNQESIVYMASTYNARPLVHVNNYTKRWGIEKLFRTTKQHLGLQDCYSVQLSHQHDHVSAVLLSFALLQLERKRRKLSSPENALRASKHKKVDFLERLFVRNLNNFSRFYH